MQKTKQESFLAFGGNQQGQTLVIMVLVMLLALGVGVAVSSRFLSTLGILSSSDFSNRSAAVAESLVERLILIPNETLREYVNFNSCGSSCSLEITGADGVVSSATATLTFLGSSADPFMLDIFQNSVAEISLDGYPENTNVNVCWDNSAASVYAVLVRGSVGSYSVEPYAVNSVGTVNSENGFATAVAGFGHANCFTVIGRSSMKALRLRPLYSDAAVFVIPNAGAQLPSQGVLIESTGVTQGVTKKVSVIKTDATLPAQFDYVLYSKSPSQALSN